MTIAALARSRPAAPVLATPTETGTLGVFQLKRYWSSAIAAQRGVPLPLSMHDRHLNYLVIHAIGLGLEQAAEYLAAAEPPFEAFERWIIETTGGIAPAQVARINAAVTGSPCPEATARRLAAVEASEPVLSADDLAHWEEHGYVVLHDCREAATQALWDHLGASDSDPGSWYCRNDHGIMVQYFQHQAFAANRHAPRIHKAFAQLWGTADLWVTTDRVGFNAPERPGWMFRGPDLHWDVSVKTPIPFGTQGILYLTDTPPEQGAFTLVPGFHRRVEAWLATLPPGADPRREDMHALGAKPIGGRAGDLIVWHQALPHGASPNRGTQPRMVQYINMFPTLFDEQEEWI